MLVVAQKNRLSTALLAAFQLDVATIFIEAVILEIPFVVCIFSKSCFSVASPRATVAWSSSLKKVQQGSEQQKYTRIILIDATYLGEGCGAHKGSSAAQCKRHGTQCALRHYLWTAGLLAYNNNSLSLVVFYTSSVRYWVN